jgi:hypothetical protein
MTLPNYSILDDPEVLKHTVEILSIGNLAVHKAREENRKPGIPNWYSVGGRIVSDSQEPQEKQPHETNHRD